VGERGAAAHAKMTFASVLGPPHLPWPLGSQVPFHLCRN